jgi:hypothetical protein
MVASPLPVPPAPASLTDQQRASYLQTLYGSSPPGFAQSMAYFHLNFITNDDFIGSVGYAQKFPDTDVLLPRYYQYSNGVQLYVRDISAMETQALPIFSAGAQPYQVFVSVDRISLAAGPAKILFPYQVAKLLAASYLHGLITRLVLDKYKQAWSNATPPVPLWTDLPLVPKPPSGPNPHPVATAMDASSWANKYLLNLTSTLVSPAKWMALSTAHKGLNYTQCLNDFTDSSLQAAGIISGWLAGDTITDPTVPLATRTACQTAIWKLVGDQYNFNEIGLMVGYTFTYLNGFIANERTRAAITANPVSPATTDPNSGPTTIYGNFCNNVAANNQGNVTPLATVFFNFVVGEFYAIASVDATRAAKYQQFIEGYSLGLTIGADVLYSQLFEEGFQLGYTIGFRDGYAQGYSAGWTEGYAVGYQAGQATWMSGLQQIVSGASGLLGDVGTVNTLLNDAITVGTAIASLF